MTASLSRILIPTPRLSFSLYRVTAFPAAAAPRAHATSRRCHTLVIRRSRAPHTDVTSRRSTFVSGNTTHVTRWLVTQPGVLGRRRAGRVDVASCLGTCPPESRDAIGRWPFPAPCGRCLDHLIDEVDDTVALPGRGPVNRTRWPLPTRSAKRSGTWKTARCGSYVWSEMSGRCGVT